ncbi:MAG: glutathione peroxidase [Proteobacteria bacterium]|nr:MAG: glutathione peroxidase [Pseudomonadota bacterium]
MASIYDFKVNRIDGTPTNLNDYKGKVLLLVNVASKCGLTPQYEGLEKLFQDYQEKGLSILGFPANEFLAQEPGTNDDIANFCRSTYGVKFPMFEKVIVKGEGQHPLYKYLTDTQPTATDTTGGALEKRLTEKGLGRSQKQDVLWNFEKFLVNRQGEVVGRFAPDTAPSDTQLTAAIEKELEKSR